MFTVIFNHANRKIVISSLKSYDCYNHGICDSVKSCIDLKTCIQPNNLNIIIKLTKPFYIIALNSYYPCKFVSVIFVYCIY